MFGFNKTCFYGIKEAHMPSISRRGVHVEGLGSQSIALLLQWWHHLVFWHKMPWAIVKAEHSLQQLPWEARANLVSMTSSVWTALLPTALQKTAWLCMTWPTDVRQKAKAHGPRSKSTHFVPSPTQKEFQCFLHIPKHKWFQILPMPLRAW